MAGSRTVHSAACSTGTAIDRRAVSAGGTVVSRNLVCDNGNPFVSCRPHLQDDGTVQRRSSEAVSGFWNAIEAITGTAHGFNVSRHAGIVLDLFPDTSDVHHNSGGVAGIFIAPDLFEQSLL